MMTRRQVLQYGLGVLSSVTSVTQTGAQQSSEPVPPNIVFLFSDDHSYPDLGCYGGAVRTPNLDRLAGEGMRFTNAYVACPQCSPSRASIFTGRSPHAVGCSRLHSPIRPETPSIIESLQQQNYYCGVYRKLHAGEDFQGRLDFYGGEEAKLSEFFDARPQDRPFFLQMGFRDPHRPYEPGAFSPAHDPSEVTVPPFLPDTEAVRADIAHYYDEIARMDAECGRLLELLEEHGVAGNTMAVFAGDNGMPFPRAKASLYDPGIRVPLVVRWPGKVKPGTVREELVSLMDLPATWLEAAGAEALPSMESRSLADLLKGAEAGPREEIFAERNWHDNWDPMRCVRTRRYKLIHNFRPEVPYRPSLDLENSPTWKSYVEEAEAGRLPDRLESLFAEQRPRIELYDLEKDPGEFHNLADEPGMADVKRDLLERLSSWMKETNDFLPPPLGAIPNPRYYDRNPL